jgi:AcrR family transcriptional regulator
MTTPEGDLRAQILETAKSLFIQRGYHGLAMREISEAVNVSKAALYYHFKDKEELFLAILRNYLDEMETGIDEIARQPVTCSEQLRLFVEFVLTQPAEQRAITRLASQEMGQLSAEARQAFDGLYHRKFIDRLKLILQTGMERGEFRSMPPEIATWALLGIMYPYFYPAHTGNKPLPAATIQEIVTIALHGLAK